MKHLFIFFQYCVPQHLISRLAGKLASSKNTRIKMMLINFFMNRFGIDLSEAEIEDPNQFESFNDFFCRALKAGARPIAGDSIVSPADGCFSQVGSIKAGRVFQAKGHDFDTDELLANAELAKHFEDGEFATIYLSPKDYHRVHLPIAGTLKSMTYIPGDLFSVNTVTTESVPRLFARNERAVCLFETDIGPVAVILVGAMIVAGIETVWGGQVAPAPTRHIQHWHYDEEQRFEAGDEIGRFKLGSTVVMLFPKGSLTWMDTATAEGEIKMGQAIAKCLTK